MAEIDIKALAAKIKAEQQKPPTGAQAAGRFLEEKEPGFVQELLSPRGVVSDVAALVKGIPGGLAGMLGAASGQAQQFQTEQPVLSQMVPGLAGVAGAQRAFFSQPPERIAEQTAGVVGGIGGALSPVPGGAALGAIAGPQAVRAVTQPDRTGAQVGQEVRGGLVGGLLGAGAGRTLSGATRARQALLPSKKELAFAQAERPSALGAELGIAKSTSRLRRGLSGDLDRSVRQIEKHSLLKGLDLDTADVASSQKIANTFKKRVNSTLNTIIEKRNNLLKELDEVAKDKTLSIAADDIDFARLNALIEQKRLGGTAATARELKALEAVKSDFLKNIDELGGTVNSQQLTKIQQNLFSELKKAKAFDPASKPGGVVSPSQQAKINASVEGLPELTSAIRNSINSHAKKVLGDKKGSRIQEFNTDFHELRPLKDGLDVFSQEIATELSKSKFGGLREVTGAFSGGGGILRNVQLPGASRRELAGILSKEGQAISGIRELSDVLAGRTAPPIAQSLIRAGRSPVLPAAGALAGQNQRVQLPKRGLSRALTGQ